MRWTHIGLTRAQNQPQDQNGVTGRFVEQQRKKTVSLTHCLNDYRTSGFPDISIPQGQSPCLYIWTISPAQVGKDN